MGLSPTGKRVELRGADFFTLKNGKIQTVNGYFDKGEVTRQIGAASLTSEQLKAYNEALSEFRNILIKLVEEAREEKKPESPIVPVGKAREPAAPEVSAKPEPSILAGSTRKLNRYLNRVPEFEELVAKYTNILPTLETDDGLPYRHMALIGIKALRRRKLEIAKTVSEVLFKTTASANLGSALLGVVAGIGCLFALGTILVAIAKGWLGINVTSFINNTDAIHLFVAFLFGCVGSVVSFLSRLSDFDSKQVRYKRFLLTYGLALPIIGGGFALVLAAALDAKIITIFSNSAQLFMVIGFLAGFSERFTKSILEMVSGKIVPQGAQK